MRRIITDEERQIIELTKAGKTARDISNALSINRSHVYYVLRANDIMPLKGLYPVEEIGEYTKEHTFKETMERFDLSQYALRRIVRTNGFSCKRKRRDMKGNNWNYRDIDIEHLKAHAHEYNCTEYYRKFNTPCTRTTLRNRAIELGLDWKNDREDVDRQVLEFAKESAGVLTRNEYIDQCHERFGVSKDRACRIAREGGYKMLRAPHPQGNLYTEEEDAIIRKYYPEIGSKCIKYLPGRTIQSIKAYASRNRIKNIHKINDHKPKVYDHLGNSYKSIEEMCKTYEVNRNTFVYRKYRCGWSLERCLTEPTREYKSEKKNK